MSLHWLRLLLYSTEYGLLDLVNGCLPLRTAGDSLDEALIVNGANNEDIPDRERYHGWCIL